MADELPGDERGVAVEAPISRDPRSLAACGRGRTERGDTLPMVRSTRRVGGPPGDPASAARLLAEARTAALSRPIVLTSPTSDLLDGLLQHPATRDYFGTRLGPTVVVVPMRSWSLSQGDRNVRAEPGRPVREIESFS